MSDGRGDRACAGQAGVGVVFEKFAVRNELLFSIVGLAMSMRTLSDL